jgi:hypothetical protein
MQPPTRHDLPLLVSTGVIVALYFWLALLRPGGEGWGRGWNMVAFFLYASPTAVVAATVLVWRRSRASGILRPLAPWAAAAGFMFPVVCIIAMRAKA